MHKDRENGKCKHKNKRWPFDFRFISSALASVGSISPFVSGSDSGLLQCSSFWLPLMLGEKNWQLLDFFRHFLTSLQLLCLLHHPVHRGVLCLLDSDHIHHQSGEEDKDHDMWWWRSSCMQSMTNFRQNLPLGAEHGQDRLHLPDQPKSLPLCAGQLHTPHVRRNLVFLANFVKQCSDLTFSLQRLVDGTLIMVQHDSGSGQRRWKRRRICFHSSWDQEHRRLPALDYICWRVNRILLVSK